MNDLRVYPAKSDKMVFTDEELRILYEKGWSDGAIAKELKVSGGTVRKRRLRLGLPRNFEPFSGAPEGSLETLRESDAQVSERAAIRMRRKDPQGFLENRRRFMRNMMEKISEDKTLLEKHILHSREYQRDYKRKMRSTPEGREHLNRIHREFMARRKKVRRVSFRVRRVYFDKIVKGEKTEEIRGYTTFWYDRLIANGQPEEAVFLCGRAVHRRRVRRVFIDVPEKILGRELSAQGLQDISTESAIIVELGEEVP